MAGPIINATHGNQNPARAANGGQIWNCCAYTSSPQIGRADLNDDPHGIRL